MTDKEAYELCLRVIVRNDKQAMEQLLNEAEGLVHYVVNRVFVRDMGANDLEQELRKYFLESIIQSYQVHRGSFRGWVVYCLRSRAWTLVKATKQLKRSLNPISLSSVNEKDDEFSIQVPTNDPSIARDEQEEADYLTNLIRPRLTTMERVIFDLRVKGYKHEEMAEMIQEHFPMFKDKKLHNVLKAVDNATQRLKIKVVEVLKAKRPSLLPPNAEIYEQQAKKRDRRNEKRRTALHSV